MTSTATVGATTDDRDGRPAPTVPFPDLVRPSRALWWMDRYVLPSTYFRRILSGKV
ncbi:MAG TPA: hypothetical protein VK964_19375 [Nocardioidaceae bacterium]|nr:hypothetical protein [Nocardioidaceae bacterium]